MPRMPSARIRFGDLVHARLAQLAIPPAAFARQHGISVDDLQAILDCTAVQADSALVVLNALGWGAKGVLDSLAELPEIPVHNGVIIPAGQERPQKSPSSHRNETQLLLRSYWDPDKLEIVRMDVCAPEHLPNLTQEFIERRLLGHKWTTNYRPEYIAEVDRSVTLAARGEVSPAIHGDSAAGGNGRVTCKRDGHLVVMRYELLPSAVVPVGRRWLFHAVDHGNLTIKHLERSQTRGEDQETTVALSTKAPPE